MGEYFKYLGLLINQAGQKSVLLTDRLTILFVPFTTLGLWMTGAKMTESIQGTIFIGVSITVLSVVILRFAAASFIIWRNDQREKAEMASEIDRPERDGELAMKKFTIDARQELSHKLARLTAIANFGKDEFSNIGVTVNEINSLTLDIDALINQVSYDVPARISAIQLREYCLDIISSEKCNRERLWAQRKITFRILHKEDHISDLLSLIELEILIEDDEGKADIFPSDATTIKELKKQIRYLGDDYYRPDIQKSLREAANSSDWLPRA